MDTASRATSNTEEKIPGLGDDDVDSVISSSLSCEASPRYEPDETTLPSFKGSTTSLFLSDEVAPADDGEEDHRLPTLLLQNELSCC
mmetsp:Transcript_20093/g.36116  ORF Transcript_20093/g.36116 Transcript_20093/m.36116 type:complete len:87 (-) Transcript_20093:328-588(-)